MAKRNASQSWRSMEVERKRRAWASASCKAPPRVLTQYYGAMQSEIPSAAPNYRLEKRQTLWLLLALSFVAGWFSAIIDAKSSYFFLYRTCVSLGATIFIVRWVALDALAFKFRITQLWIFLFVFFSFLVVPFYLIKTRGKAAWRPILGEIGLVFVYSIAMGIGKTIATALGL